MAAATAMGRDAADAPPPARRGRWRPPWRRGVAGLCGLILMVKPDPDPEWPATRTFGALVVAIVVMSGYAYALEPLGFLLPTAVTAAILSYQISPRVVPSVVAGIGLSVGLFALFKYALGLGLIPFPHGLGG